MNYKIGVVGLGVMGRNLALNMERNGFPVAGYDLDAQKTNAYQSSKNILMSDDATINTKPQLEIYADDVKCSHGSTTGQLNEEALFYLRSRGLGIDSAKNLLLFAFANDVLNTIRIDSLKNYLEELVNKKLEAKSI